MNQKNMFSMKKKFIKGKMGKEISLVVKICFRFDNEFLSKLNHLILQRYKDLNVEDEESVSNDQVHCEESIRREE